MPIVALGYLGVRAQDLGEWSDYAGKLLALQKIDLGGGSLTFRMDDRRQRLVVMEEEGPSLAFAGWEVAAPNDLEAFATRLENAGTKVTHASRALCDQRFVSDMIYFSDPDGNGIELFTGPMIASDPFVPGRPIQGFKTGPHGMGHAVLHVREIEPSRKFYTELLGFRLSDFGLEPYPLYFFHVNGRHHSFALVGSGRRGFHHFMIEYQNLDDVGQGYDIACLEEDRVAYTLGRHLNDHMTSFYSHTPSGFFVESGWGGRIIDPDSWVPHERTEGPSIWGHERLYLPDEPRTRLREMRMEAARKGVRVPPVHECPWLFAEMSGRGNQSE